MSMDKVVCHLDCSHPVFCEGQLSHDSRFELDHSSLTDMNIEIDLAKLTDEERSSRVLRNVTLEQVEWDWELSILPSMGINCVEVPKRWEVIRNITIDIDFSQATSKTGQVYGKIINKRYPTWWSKGPAADKQAIKA